MFAEALENYAKATQASMLALQKIAALNHEINMTASKMFIKDDQ